MQKAVIVVPCYNESKRIDVEGFRRFFNDPWVDLLFVNDGSKDNTSEILASFCASTCGRASLIDLSRNQGKAEAVREGMLHALDVGAEVTGYYDADLATPPEEMIRLVRTIDERCVDVAIASRVQLLGTRIDRTPMRHYLGRVFATLASLVIKMPVYDTQCGAKAFRAGDVLRAALADPFHSRWFFDVELLGRLHHGATQLPGLPIEAFIEVPLLHWRDVPGSKLRPLDFPKSLVELIRIRRSLQFQARRVEDSRFAGTPELTSGSLPGDSK